MRFHRWGRVGHVGEGSWEHHVFPNFGRPDCFTTLCGLHFGGIGRVQRGEMQGKCEACAALAPKAEERAEAAEAGEG